MSENWRPTASLDTLRSRARILQDIRAFFAERDVLEIQVPAITLSGITDVNIESIPIDLNGQGGYLHTSPEYPMKRLLAAGMGDCYYLGSVYRQGEHGQRHNPEFTMLEWYRLGFAMYDLVNEVIEFVQFIIASSSVSVSSISYADALNEIAGLDVFTCSIQTVKAVFSEREIDAPELDTLDAYLVLLMSLVVIPNLSVSADKDFDIVVLHSYPLSQAALAQELQDENGRPVAGRFEVIVNGLEIANGYQECRDAEVLRQRFNADNQLRRNLKKSEMPLDRKFLAAHLSGLPQCSGVALGFDRLCMLALGKARIDEVIAFPIDRC